MTTRSRFQAKARFWLIVGGFFLITLIGLLGLQASSYRIGIDVQRLSREPACLPYSVFLMHMKIDRLPHYGDYVVAAMPDTGMVVGGRPGDRIIKRVAGVPGDHIKIEGVDLYINGMHRDRLWLAKSLPGKDVGSFDAEYTLKEGEYFLMGTTKESFDSRYWGALSLDSIRGFAHPLI